ncbi:hypothetical protein BGZ52_001569 [Haplosporangium bisporale]|nr:hypothetical protein BGZ52_001569 [Haplosporangium bisporale]KAF9213763.1 hypothetical protein BGZ59_004855 [Podila verticillata]KAI9242388.1 MAG: C2 domain-containing protein [Podila humilis]KFH63554.1 hypothetical protein MVEG_10963 [Podila verticillata NRRL 6337]
MMLGQQSLGSTLTIAVHSAANLQDVETIGKQDPYFQFTLDISNPKSIQKTFVHKNGGKSPVWNQTFNVPLNGESELFFEIMDEETTADAVIGFAAINLSQVLHAPGGVLNAAFPVYTPAGKEKGEVTLTLSASNVPGQGLAPAGFARGQSHISEAHLKRVKSLKNKERAADVGVAVMGGLAALGVGLLANKVVNDNKKEEQAHREAEAAAQAEHERFESEKKQFEEQRAAYERTQSEQQSIHTTSSTHTSHHEEHGHSHKHGHGHSQREWDAVGTYSAGDKVSYHGRAYICLQGHTSNPTWEPTQAHSLWRAD